MGQKNSDLSEIFSVFFPIKSNEDHRREILDNSTRKREIIFKCLEILYRREISFLLVFLLRLLLFSFVLPGQFPLGVDEVEDHHQHHEDDDDVLTLDRHVSRHPGVEACLDSFNLLPDIVYKAHIGVFGVRTVCNLVSEC